MLFVAAVAAAFAPRQLAPQLKPAQRPAAVLLEATAESTAAPAAAEESSPAPTAADPAVATLDLLEWPRLSAHVAQHASTAFSRELYGAGIPLPRERAESEALLEETAEAFAIERSLGVPLELKGFTDWLPLVSLASKGAVLEGPQLASI